MKRFFKNIHRNGASFSLLQTQPSVLDLKAALVLHRMQLLSLGFITHFHLRLFGLKQHIMWQTFHENESESLQGEGI